MGWVLIIITIISLTFCNDVCKLHHLYPKLNQILISLTKYLLKSICPVSSIHLICTALNYNLVLTCLSILLCNNRISIHHCRSTKVSANTVKVTTITQNVL